MRRKRYSAIVLLVMFCLSICLGGCAGKNKASSGLSADESSEEVGILEIEKELPGGRLMVLGGLEHILVYFDYAEETFVPICTRADCAHEPGDEGCPANLLSKNLAGICVYQGQFWYLKVEEGRKSFTESQRMVLCRADLTGENAEELHAWEMEISGFYSILYDGYFYVVDAKCLWDEDIQLIGIENRLLRADLETGEITEIEEKEEAQKTLYSIFGFRDGKIYYCCYPGERYPKGAIVLYDCETGEKEMLPIAEGDLEYASMNEKYLLYTTVREDGQDRHAYVMELATGEEIADVPCESYLVSFSRGEEIEFLDLEQGRRLEYDLKTGEYYPVERDERLSFFGSCASTGNGYFGQLINEEGYLTEYAYISNEELERGEEPRILTKDEWPIW